jgi:hypothetical protein
VLVVAVVAAVGAYAYFTTSGSGTGTATVGHSTALTLHGSSVGSLYPTQSVPVSFTVDNSSTGNQQLGTIYLASVRACVGAGSSWDGTSCTNSGTESTGCESVQAGDGANPVTPTADWYMQDVVENQDFPNGNAQPANFGGTLVMNDFGDQTAAGCENANLTLLLSTRP